MLQLPTALAALAPYRQFLVCQFVPDITRPGKTHKYPVSFADGSRHDAHDPVIWTDYATAIATAQAWGGVAADGSGYGIGFTFTKADPFYFVDVDDCAVFGPDGAAAGWKPIVAELLNRLPGAFVEISHSGRGLHIIATGTAPEVRYIKEHNNLFDLYTDKRFVALTGTSAFGDAATEHTAALHALTEKYLRKDPAVLNAQWTDEPVPEWRGPADDAQLLQRAMRSKSMANVFGNKASFEELWTADPDALAKAYPDDQGTGRYDASKVDAALAQHLAFWTGKDCARIERLMRQSALARPKWDDRDDYLCERTILGCVARQRDVLMDKPPELPELPGIMAAAVPAPMAGPIVILDAGAPPPPPPPPADDRPKPRLVNGSTILDVENQIKIFSGCVYVTDIHRVLVPGGMLLKPEQFKVIFGGYTFVMDPANERPVSRDAWEAFTQSQAIRVPRADGICFKPAQPAGKIISEAGRTLANIWWPVSVPRKVGDPTPFLVHLAKLLPNVRDQTILLSYMAACVQHVGTKFQWAPLIQGVEGNGKTLFSRCVAEAVGRRYTHWPKASQLASPFNAWLLGNVFFAVEDIFIPGDRGEILEELKPMITGNDLEIQGKGVDQKSSDVCGNFIFNSNHKDGLRKTGNDRRFAILYCAQQRASDLERDGMAGDYFHNLYNVWFDKQDGYAIVSELLHTYPIPDEFNPAKACQRAPMTTSTEEAIGAGLGMVEQEIVEAIEQRLPGFAGGWVSSIMLKQLLETIRYAQRIPHAKRDALMEGLGYHLHPGLPGGRVNNIVPTPDAGLPKLYILKGHPKSALTGVAAIAKAYAEAQQPVLEKSY